VAAYLLRKLVSKAAVFLYIERRVEVGHEAFSVAMSRQCLFKDI
jgi:hypothetical protein